MPFVYRIIILEQLAIESDASWLDGMTVSFNSRSETILEGEFADQAALVSWLLRLHHLNLTLLSLMRKKRKTYLNQRKKQEQAP